MEVDVEVRGEDLIEYYRTELFPDKRFKLLVGLLFCLPAAILGGAAVFFGGSVAIWLVSLSVVYLLAGWVPYQRSVKSSFEKRVASRNEKERAGGGPAVVGLHPHGLTLAQVGRTETLPWARVKKVVDAESAFYFVLDPLSARVVPKRAFGDRFTERSFFFQAVAYQRGMALGGEEDGALDDEERGQ